MEKPTDAILRLRNYVVAHEMYLCERDHLPSYGLADIRKYLGLSQREMGSKIGCNFTWISKLEHGVEPISPELAAKIIELWREKDGPQQRL